MNRRFDPIPLFLLATVTPAVMGGSGTSFFWLVVVAYVLTLVLGPLQPHRLFSSFWSHVTVLALGLSLGGWVKGLGLWAPAGGALLFLCLWRLPFRLRFQAHRGFIAALTLVIMATVVNFVLQPSWSLLLPDNLDGGKWVGLAFSAGVFTAISNSKSKTHDGHAIWILALSALGLSLAWEFPIASYALLFLALVGFAWSHSFSSYIRQGDAEPRALLLGALAFIVGVYGPDEIGRHWWNGVFPILMGISLVLGFWHKSLRRRVFVVAFALAGAALGLALLGPFPNATGSILVAALASFLFWMTAYEARTREVASC